MLAGLHEPRGCRLMSLHQSTISRAAAQPGPRKGRTDFSWLSTLPRTEGHETTRDRAPTRSPYRPAPASKPHHQPNRLADRLAAWGGSAYSGMCQARQHSIKGR